MSKLYIVVRGDLLPGLRAAQACHALREFAAAHPEVDREWFERSNTIVILEVAGLEELADLAFELDRRDVRYASFTEPDIGYEMTALAIAPEGGRWLSRLPLAFGGEASRAAA